MLVDDQQGSDLRIIAVSAHDLRWPTSATASGSDAMHPDPDYSCVYVRVQTERGACGYGLTFTLGRGTDIVRLAVERLVECVVLGRNAGEIFKGFGQFWRELTSEPQMRWVSIEIQKRCRRNRA